MLSMAGRNQGDQNIIFVGVSQHISSFADILELNADSPGRDT